MKLGIFAKTFPRPTIDEVFAAVSDLQLDCVQFNWSCVGLPTLPKHIPVQYGEEVSIAASKRAISISAISGTFNLVEPDVSKRTNLFRRLRTLAESCALLSTNIITLCTGTRDADDMWRAHPDNNTSAAWSDLVVSVRQSLNVTAETGVTLAVEPEPANIVNSVEKAIRLLDEVGSDRLKIVFDGANILNCYPGCDQQDVLESALELLAPHSVVAHVKDFPGICTSLMPPSRGFDLDLHLRLISSSTFCGPLIIHGVAESHVPQAVQAVRANWCNLSNNAGVR